MMMRMLFVIPVCILLLCVVWVLHGEAPGAAMPLHNVVSEISVNTGNGFGSTGIFARRFLNTDVSVGSDITYIQNAVAGDSFQINTTGLYSISDTDLSTNGDTFSITVNSDPATEITNLQAPNRLCSSSMDPLHLQNCAVTLLLRAGDVIRAHRSTGAIGAIDASPFVRFVIARAG
jgi:hypothetical protein